MQNLRKVVIIGTALAVLFRLFFVLFVSYFLQFKGVRTFGGFLLFWIAYKLYEDIIKDKIHNAKFLKKPKFIKEGDKKSFRKALITIIIADLTISFDNVIGVVGAAKGNFGFMIFGILLTHRYSSPVSTSSRQSRYIPFL